MTEPTNNPATETARPDGAAFCSSDVVEAHALDAPTGAGRWLAHRNGCWEEFEVRNTYEGMMARLVKSTAMHRISWWRGNRWGRWQAVAACSSTM